MTTETKKTRFVVNHYRREGVAGRVPLPGSALANHTFDGFGSKCFVKVSEEQETESAEMKEFFPDDPDKGDDPAKGDKGKE